MVKGVFDLDDDGTTDIVIKGGILALIAIILIADLMITGGQLIRDMLDWVLSWLAQLNT